MALLEFINDTLQKNNIQGDAKQIKRMIKDIAEQRAVDGECAISDSEVEEMIINNAELSTKLAKGKTEIMFIRQKDKPNKPYYTLELKGKKVKQVRGKDNVDPNKNVKAFVSKWANKFKLKYTGEQEAYA